MKTTFFKTNTILVVTFCLVLASFFTTSCSKPENGKDGVTGAAGTANVMYSEWEPVVFTNSGGTSVGHITAAKITQEILDRGTVLVYFKLNNGIYLANLSTGSEYIYYSNNLGQIKIFKTLSTVTNTTPFRYIIIPVGVSANGKMAQTDYSKMSYSEVCKSLSISE